ncbi:MAG: hypothetical protein COX45_02215 [Candidatus Portnoybacteria bacterium CG23_combo_of_CG06-09_8_20_14_all_44_36]|uniref:Uncharacterized protein n=1 Tax=Candidatus Portnoybacteria bacterium CG_4_9_14_3_um_filter_43_11 TaxID=1974805 RepID=A0A2M7YLY6_9BACT|nr:MAG: hypothetical protein COX45_02215 [Candidatus Portnoybacteria bacterium CG23_combo_of_CG06-09_8_20_14_all_44_36]PJA63977.1 MAG: hypothetical protein CO160_01105 [Candidatus Portnoybacteria bacterium CG_4_9_14_3_um_filter_43_11]
MGLFFPSPKKIKSEEFKKTLEGMKKLNEREKAYVEGVFQKPLQDGMTKDELRKEISGLKRNFGDPLTSSEVEKVKEQLEEKLK